MTDSVVKPGETESTLIYQRLSMEPLESQVSTDACPQTPVPSVQYGENTTCICFTNPDHTDQDYIEVSTDQKSHSLTHSRTYPEFCPTCNKTRTNSNKTSPISETQSCINLSAENDSVDGAHLHSLPDKLKEEYFDVMILYAEADRTDATSFLKHLRDDIRLKNGEAIKAVLYDGEEISGMPGLKFEQLDKAFGNSSYTFVYLTKNLINDVWCKISQESMLMQTVNDKEGKWRVVPVYTMRVVDYDFKIPFGINALNEIRYYNPDENYKRRVASLIEKRVPERQLKEKKLAQMKRNWTENHGQRHTDMSPERRPNDVSNDTFLVPTLDPLTMVQPQHSTEMDFLSTDTNRVIPSKDLDKSSQSGGEGKIKEMGEDVSRDFLTGEATPLSALSVDELSSSKDQSERSEKAVLQVFELQERRRDNISPDMESQALFVKLKEDLDESRQSVGEGEIEEMGESVSEDLLAAPSVDEVSSPDNQSDRSVKAVVEAFDLKNSTGDDISPDMESQAVFVKLKEEQCKNAVLEAEIAKLKDKVIGQKCQYEKRCEEMETRFFELEKQVSSTRKETTHSQDMFEGSQDQYIGLERNLRGVASARERKYQKAKKTIKEYQQREKDFLVERESPLLQQTEKGQQYNALVKSLNDRDGDRGCSCDISPGHAAAVAVTQACGFPNSSTGTCTSSNIAQSTSSLKIDLKLKCDNTDSVKIGIEMKQTQPAGTSSDTKCSNAISKEEKTGQCWHCQYFLKEHFCKYSIHNSHINGWHCFFSFIDEYSKSTESYFTQSGEFGDPLDDPLD